MAIEMYRDQLEYRSKGGAPSRPSVSIRIDGKMALSKALAAPIGNQRWCQLFFDRETKKVQIKLVPEGTEHAHRLWKSGYNQREVNAKGFLAYFGIPHTETARYSASYDEATRMITVRLDQRIVGRKAK